MANLLRETNKTSAIILADEPPGNLDAKNKHVLVDLLSNLKINQGTTIIVITHDGQVASPNERSLFLKDVKITKEKQGLNIAEKEAQMRVLRRQNIARDKDVQTGQKNH